jgi:hypothetical protein
MRRTEWTREDEALSLTERPYTPDELRTLVARIRALRRTGFPNGKLQMLYEAIVDSSKQHAMSTWAFVAGRARRSNDDEKNQFKELLDFFAVTDAMQENALRELFQWPWRKRNGNPVFNPYA